MECIRHDGYLQDGYPHEWIDGRKVKVHRSKYEERFGPIPDGMVLHHTCGNRWCVNPEHGVPLTRSEHQRVHSAQGDFCKKGHPLSLAWGGKRKCMVCHRERARLSKRRRTAARKAPLLAMGALLVALLIPGAAGAGKTQTLPVRKQADTTRVTKQIKSATYCPQVKSGLSWYRGQIASYRTQRWLSAPQFVEKPKFCSRALELAKIARERLAAEKAAFEEWHSYHWDWAKWLPDKWQRIGACETGYGVRPGNWRHANSSFQGAFGFAVSSWDAFVPRADPKAGPYPSEAYLATPRQQWEVALAIWRAYGYSGWGCRGA